MNKGTFFEATNEASFWNDNSFPLFLDSLIMKSLILISKFKNSLTSGLHDKLLLIDEKISWPIKWISDENSSH